jgi:trans-2-enoyl-CoA reductase
MLSIGVKSGIISIKSGIATASKVSLTHSRTMITSSVVMYSEHGEPKDVLKTHSHEIDETKLGDNEVIVKTLASPVNPSDINQIQGVYPSKPEKNQELGTDVPSAVCGNEGLFEVIHVGTNVKGFSVGDWAIPANVNFGTWRTHALASEDKFFKIPNPTQSRANGKKLGLSINQAATISVNPPTALLMLTHYLKLTPQKDWFIQNGGNSAVGQYAIQIGKILGFNSISVIRDRPDLQKLIDELKAKGATQVITEEQNNSREFGATIKDWQKQSGGQIKLALNCVGGKNSTGIARKLATNGLMLTYGGMSMQPVMMPTSLHIFKNITSSGFWVTELLKNNPELKTKTLNQIVEWYEDEKLIDAPSVQTKYDGSSSLSDVYINGVANSKQGKQLITY